MRSATVSIASRRASLRCLLALLLMSGVSAVDAIYVVTAANRLVRLRSDTPGTVVEVTAAITGLQAAETVLGIDLRPSNGVMQLIGSTGRMYTLNLTSGAATAISGIPAFTPTGTAFGIDINPTVDRVRVVSNTGQNLRLDPNTGALAVADTNLGFATGDANQFATPAVMAAAYSNNTAGPMSTTLFVLDSGVDVLATQLPPNDGKLNTVGPLGINIDANACFDISGITGTAYAVMQVAGTPNLYTINLSTGAATLVGAIGVTGPVTGLSVGPAAGSIRYAFTDYSAAEDAGNAVITLLREAGSAGAVGVNLNTAIGSAIVGTDYTGINTPVTFADGETTKTVLIPLLDDVLSEDLETVPLTLSLPTGGADLYGSTTNVLAIVDNEFLPATVVALTATNTLVQFNAATPGTITSTIAVTGLQAAENLLGIDYRPANGQLLGLGSTSQLYSIVLATGVATAIGTPFSPVLSGTAFGFDVNPTVDRVRVVSDTGQNLRLQPDTGATAFTDPVLDFTTGDLNDLATPAVMSAAYTNNLVGAVGTTLYDLDSGVDVLATQLPPNDGKLNTVGALGVAATSSGGFDIRTVGSTNSAFAVLRVGTSSNLYAISLTTGSASLIGAVGDGSDIRGLALVTGAGSAPTGGGHTPAPTVSADGGGGGCGLGGNAAAMLLMMLAFFSVALRRKF